MSVVEEEATVALTNIWFLLRNFYKNRNISNNTSLHKCIPQETACRELLRNLETRRNVFQMCNCDFYFYFDFTVRIFWNWNRRGRCFNLLSGILIDSRLCIFCCRQRKASFSIFYRGVTCLLINLKISTTTTQIVKEIRKVLYAWLESVRTTQKITTKSFTNNLVGCRWFFYTRATIQGIFRNVCAAMFLLRSWACVCWPISSPRATAAHTTRPQPWSPAPSSQSCWSSSPPSPMQVGHKHKLQS